MTVVSRRDADLGRLLLDAQIQIPQAFLHRRLFFNITLLDNGDFNGAGIALINVHRTAKGVDSQRCHGRYFKMPIDSALNQRKRIGSSPYRHDAEPENA